jgi:hypothetical protein
MGQRVNDWRYYSVQLASVVGLIVMLTAFGSRWWAVGTQLLLVSALVTSTGLWRWRGWPGKMYAAIGIALAVVGVVLLLQGGAR